MRIPFLTSKFPFQFQLDAMDCGPACLKMIAEYYGKSYSLEHLREISYISREGVSLLSISEAAENIGFRTLMVQLPYEKLVSDCPVPCILHWDQNHFVVLYDVKKRSRLLQLFSSKKERDLLSIADPSHNLITLDKSSFLKSWVSSGDGKGIALFFEPTDKFYETEIQENKEKKFSSIFQYLKPYKKLLLQVVFGMLAASLISLVFPFLTQALVDYGIRYKDFGFVTLVLLAQLFLFVGETVIELLRSWIMLHMNTRISLSIVSNFLMKLMRLPIRFFDSKAVGDVTQRIVDHHRIESFLTGVSIDSVFSVITILIYTIILGIYSKVILLVFLLLSTFGVTWILLFQKRRRHLDYRRFQRNKETQDKLYELINGMQEIKLNGSETHKRWQWEHLQIKLFKLNMGGLALEQYQKVGFLFFTQLKNIFIAFLAARAVINNDISLGAMLSISFIVGQTNGPLERLIAFIRAAQDAKISLDRLQEVHKKQDEEQIVPHTEDDSATLQGSLGLPVMSDIRISNLDFQYEGPSSPVILKDVDLLIQKGKVTAIVGASGSGKTTLLKLLLNFYAPVRGKIMIGDAHLGLISPKGWRKQCGTVMQDGYIFSDTIANNIAADGKEIDFDRLDKAIMIANLKEFIDGLPMGYATKIGASGVGISGGQRQRILIARAVYKNPKYLFFDEATSSLDANNEKVIIENLNNFFENKTVVIIAHRLSTVKNADKIVVLDKGQIVETGNHDMLVKIKGHYFTLVKNQLELGE